MADRLTQLQDCLDQLLTQMYATIKYIDTHHAFASIEGQVDQFLPVTDSQDATQVGSANQSATQLATQPTQATASSADAAPIPARDPNDPVSDPPALFEERLRELAQDLVVKEQQIEQIIYSLPGIGNSQELQEKRLLELEKELREVETERAKWVEEREKLLDKVDGWIGGIRRV